MGPPKKGAKGEKATGARSKAATASSSSSNAKKKRAQAKKKRNGQKYLEDLIDLYMKPELKDLEEKEDESDEDNPEGAVKMNLKDEILLCAKEGCKRKRGGRAGACVKDLCFLCCHESRNKDSVYCPGHYKMSQQKDTEDRYIAEGLNLKKPSKTKFFHYEDKFTNYNQTVTVWCVRDFLLNPAYSGDVLADVGRDKRSRLMLQRRSGIQPVAASGSSGSCGSSSGSPRKGRSSSSSSSQASKKGKVAEEPEIDLSNSVVVRGWQALRALHAQESKQRFDGVLEAWRERGGKDKDSTASLLK